MPRKSRDHNLQARGVLQALLHLRAQPGSLSQRGEQKFARIELTAFERRWRALWRSMRQRHQSTGWDRPLTATGNGYTSSIG